MSGQIASPTPPDGHVHRATTYGSTSTDTITPETQSDVLSPGRNADFAPVPHYRCEHHRVEVEDYFHGPLDLERHNKWPLFLRMHGSVLPKMIIPLFFVALWSTMITVISRFVHDLGIESVLLTVLGFVVGLALSFRSTTAYERYNDGRKYWTQLNLTARNLARLFWVHAPERFDESDELGKQDLLAKLTAINLINAFAVALMHHLRFEPSTEYPDLQPLISHLDTFASRADQTVLQPKMTHPVKAVGEYLGMPFAISNPRRLVKRSKDNLGNLPLEILNYLSSYVEDLISNKRLPTPAYQSNAMALVNSMAEVLTGTERVLNTPLPAAYGIMISQISWVYVLLLPFQLYNSLKWVTIPASIVASYIILGLSVIGREIENPFGEDVNDLPMGDYCREIAADLDALTSTPAPQARDWINHAENHILYPLSMTDHDGWSSRSTEQIREALKAKATYKAKRVLEQRAKMMLQSDLLEV